MKKGKNGFHEFYYDTHFKLNGDIKELPASYSIITAFATTGEEWDEDDNEKADLRLKLHLENAKVDKWRMTGYSPDCKHKEKSWATTLSPDEACVVGKEFLQHAIYFVDEGILSVMLCDNGEQDTVGPMSERIHAC